jgi:hypothetical protein
MVFEELEFLSEYCDCSWILAEAKIFRYSTAFTLAVGLNQPPL